MNDIGTVRIELQYSRVGTALLALGTIATVGIVCTLPLAGALRLALAFGVGALALEALDRALAVRGPRAARRLTLQRDGAIEVESPSGACRVGSVRPGCFVAPWLTVVRWRPVDASRDRTVLILPGMAAAEDFRRLRVLLRWS